MKPANDPDIICRLKEIRTRKKITQTQLADLVGIKRQAIYDLETGRYLPNTSIALRLARNLSCRVEDIFCEARQENHPVVLVDRSEETDPRVSVAKIRNTLYAYPLSSTHSIIEEMRAADGLLEPGQKRVTLLKSTEALENTAVLLGCDPAFSILGHHVQKSRIDAALHCRFASSGKALRRLAASQAHIAGIHMHSKGSMDGNQEFVRSALKNFEGLLVAFATFEEGVMVARGNPLGIRNPGDLAQKKVRFVNREKGAALRELLDDCLARLNIPFGAVNGYHETVGTHSQGAQKIVHNICDAALGLPAVAAAFNLDFISFAQVRCDLVIPQDLLHHTGVRMALDTLQMKTFRKEMSCLPGYDTACSGKIMARF